jgi:hypothetical protein
LDTRRILTALAFCAAQLYAAPTASEIFEKTTKIISVPQIKYQVLSTMTSGDYTEQQLFSVARRESHSGSASLICFSAPQTVKGTAILIKKTPTDSQTSIYFPSLGRTRFIPKQDENKEVFGLGLSFSQIKNNRDGLTLLENIEIDGKPYYQIKKEGENETTIYIIDMDDLVLKKMSIYENEKLEKEVVVDESKEFQKSKIITKWHIDDYKKEKHLLYVVQEDTIKTSVSKRVFKNSALSHCKP